MGVPFASYVSCAILFLTFAIFLLLRRARTLTRLAAILASLATSLWAVSAAYEFSATEASRFVPQLLEVARTCGWIMLVVAALPWASATRRATIGYFSGALCLVAAATVGILGPLPITERFALPQTIPVLFYLLLSVLGLVLIENLFRNTPAGHRWAVKFLCLGVGSIFAYDFYLYTDALLLRRIDHELLAARGAIDGLATPLLAIWAIRSRLSGSTVVASHKFVFYSTTFIGSGVYLLLMAAVGEYIRRYGGNWGRSFQVAFLFGTLLVLIVPLFSGSFRARLRIAIAKNLFGYKYDYREEWLRFIHTISAGEIDSDLPTRVVRAVADILDSPEGGIWLNREPNRYSLIAAWNISRWKVSEADSIVTASHPMIKFFARADKIINVTEVAARVDRGDDLVLPDWIGSNRRAWLVVPLPHKDRVLGFMVLGQPRAPRDLNWEDYDLLNTVARQAGSYLAQHEADIALSDARQFETFNRHFAFIAHDIKNLSSRLSLIVSSASRHMGNPNFQADMLETVRSSVEKLNQLLRRLNPQSASGNVREIVEMASVVRDALASQDSGFPPIAAHLDNRAGLNVMADREQLIRVVRNLIQNAVEAAGADGHIDVRLSAVETAAVLEIEDDGPGMDEEFIRNNLFRPFRTTKGSGYGIGAYEAREFARMLGGSLDVASKPGQGTVFRLSLPLSKAEASAAAISP